MTHNKHRKLYRSRNGWIFGVCQGLADYAEISAFWVRVAVFLAMIPTGFMPMVLIYIVAAIFLQPAPVVQPVTEEDWEFYQSYSSDRKLALHRLRQRFSSLDKRTRRMENFVTDKRYDWERRFKSGS